MTTAFFDSDLSRSTALCNTNFEHSDATLYARAVVNPKQLDRWKLAVDFLGKKGNTFDVFC
jgi:hypothetical protein